MANNPYVNKVVYGSQVLIDITDTTATPSDVLSGKYFYSSDGSKCVGTATGAGAMSIVETQDPGGGTVLSVTGVDISNDTVTADKLVYGYTAHDHSGTAITGTFNGIDVSATTAIADDVAEGKYFYTANGTLTLGTAGGETMTLLKYGTSTWAEFIAAYNSNSIVYCRASSNSNPASGSQTRLAFMAYVNNETDPTNVEFQYYRSVATHSNTQQGDQVYVYKLDKTSGWSVTVREAYTKIVAGTGLTSSYSNGVLTISLST